MQGGGTGLFAAVPMNIMNTGTADYLVTGEKYTPWELQIIFEFLSKQNNKRERLLRIMVGKGGEGSCQVWKSEHGVAQNDGIHRNPGSVHLELGFKCLIRLLLRQRNCSR